MVRVTLTIAALLLLVVPGARAGEDAAVGPPRLVPVLPGSLVEGDAIFRVGRGIEAEAVRSLDSGRQLSHVGLAYRVDGQWLVLHADSGAGMIAEPLARYLAADRASGHAVYRHPLLAGSPQARAAAFALLEARPAFDEDFDLADPGRLYCTEFVWRVLRQVGLPNRPRLTGLAMPFMQMEVMLPSDLIAGAGLSQVAGEPEVSG